MGTGFITLYWYAACFLFTAFVAATCTVLFYWGRRRERKAREARAGRRGTPSATDPSPPGTGAP